MTSYDYWMTLAVVFSVLLLIAVITGMFHQD